MNPSLLLVLLQAPDPQVDWVRAHAVPLATAEPGRGVDDLRPLAAIVGEARIVGLGEPTHGTREAFQMKHRILEFLAGELGFSIFAIEANMPEAYELNRYVLRGEGDPRALIRGMYFTVWQTEEVLALVEWMRGYNAAAAGGDRRPLQFTGFDLQTGDVAAAIVSDFAQRHAADLHPASARALTLLHGAQRAAEYSGEAFGIATWSFPAAAARGHEVAFRGWIRTEDVTDGYAGLWWNAMHDGQAVAFGNLGERAPQGTTEWTEYEVRLELPEDVSEITFGAILPGSGAAWFDDLEVRIDGQPYAGDFDSAFEGPEPKYATPWGSRYQVRVVAQRPHQGAGCLEIRGSAPPAGVDAVDPAAAVAAAQELYDALLARRAALVERAGAWDADWALQNARVLQQCAALAAAGSAGYRLRDEFMADNVEWILRQNPGARIVLWAHNGHVSRGALWGNTWMGAHLERKFPGQMVVFGFATAEGQYSAMRDGAWAEDNPLAAPPPDSVEALLRRAGLPHFLLDIRGARPGDPATGWLTETRSMRSIGAAAMAEQFFPMVPRDMFDVLVYSDRTSAARQLPRTAGR